MDELSQEFIPSLDDIETSGLLNSKPDFIDFKARYHRTERLRTIEILKTMDCGLKNPRYKQVEDCRSFSYFARNKTSGLVKIIASSCKQRWCPTCAVAKAKFITNEVKDFLKACYKPKMLTVTLKHSNDPLSDQINKLYKAFRQLRRYKYFKKQTKGGIWFFQVHYNYESNGWHPHIHCLITGENMPQSWLADVWDNLTTDSFIVDIRAIKDITKASKYVARYCARPAMLSKLTDSHAQEIIQALHGRRLCGKFGICRVVSLTPKKSEEANDWENIGSWNSVVKKPCNINTARKIIDAWIHKSVLSPSITLRYQDRNETITNGNRLPEFSLEDLGIPIEGEFP